MLKTKGSRFLMPVATIVAVGILLMVTSSSTPGQQSTARPVVEKASDRALVEQFMPPRISDLHARNLSRGSRIPPKVAFIAADLNATGRQDFLVAVYSVSASAAIRVLRKEGDWAVLIDEPKKVIMGGMSPRVSLIDVDHSGHPGIIVDFTENHGETMRWFWKWDGNSLNSFGTTYSDAGWADTLLNDATFLDLDGDGILEIVNPPEYERPTPGEDRPPAPSKYQVYAIGENEYHLSDTFFEGFFECPANLSHDCDNSFLASRPGAPYVITIANGDGRNVAPVSNAEVRFNGEVVAGADKINRNARYLKIPVTAKAPNRVDLHVSGEQGSKLFIGVGPALPSDPQAPDRQ